MVQLYHNRNVNKNSLLFKVDYTRCYENPKNVNSEVPLRQTNTAKWHKLLGFFI